MPACIKASRISKFLQGRTPWIPRFPGRGKARGDGGRGKERVGGRGSKGEGVWERKEGKHWGGRRLPDKNLPLQCHQPCRDFAEQRMLNELVEEIWQFQG